LWGRIGGHSRLDQLLDATLKVLLDGLRQARQALLSSPFNQRLEFQQQS